VHCHRNHTVIMGRVTAQSNPSPEPGRSWSYDLQGHTLSANINGQLTTSFTWDALGRMTNASTSGLGSVSYVYDVASRRVRMNWPDGYFVTYDYDNTGNMTAIRENGGASNAARLARYSYGSLGQLGAINRTNGATMLYTLGNYGDSALNYCCARAELRLSLRRIGERRIKCTVTVIRIKCTVTVIRVGDFAGLLRVGEDEILSAVIRRAETVGRPLGDDAFMAHIKVLSGRDMRPGKRGPRQRDG
jgi:YD repeat-containing protein